MVRSGKLYHVNGLNLHVIDQGNADLPIIIFLHGFPEFWYSWRKQVPFFLKHGYRVVVPDQRGYNLSEKPKKVRDYAVENLVKDILELIREISRDKIYLVAHDWGAAVAWRIASQNPELLIKMVIINLPHPSVMRETLKKNPVQMMKSWYIAFFQLPFIPETFLQFANFKLLEMTLLKTSSKGTFTKEDITEYKRAWQNRGTVTSMLNWYRAIKYRTKSSIKSPVISIPTLIIWGEKDAALDKSMAKKSLKYCSDGKLISLPDATHWAHQDKSELVNQKILEHFRE